MKAAEVNLDGLVGPTHNYAGLAFGNVTSAKNARSISNPKQAALQGLQKMKFLHDLGIGQMIMPPQPRPDMHMIKQLGFKKLADIPEDLLPQFYSASSMWTANAATLSPSADTKDGKVHITPANLVSNLHRSIEAHTTARYLKHIFSGPHFVHHNPLPAQAAFADEGAANHMRLTQSHGERGVEIFVYGQSARKFPARQSRGASEAIIRLHGLDPKHTVLLCQNPLATDVGVFHNDVISMSNEQLFIYHERAYLALDAHLKKTFTAIVIREKDLPLKDAVATYFFNSQIVTLPCGGVAVIAPAECEENAKTRACFGRLLSQGHVDKVYYLDVRESMKNGGGPACLRLRVILTEEEQKATHPYIWLNDKRYHLLCQWIEKHYRDRIAPDDLRDGALAKESDRALAGLSSILKMPLGELHGV